MIFHASAKNIYASIITRKIFLKEVRPWAYSHVRIGVLTDPKLLIFKKAFGGKFLLPAFFMAGAISERQQFMLRYIQRAAG